MLSTISLLFVLRTLIKDLVVKLSQFTNGHATADVGPRLGSSSILAEFLKIYYHILDHDFVSEDTWLVFVLLSHLLDQLLYFIHFKFRSSTVVILVQLSSFFLKLLLIVLKETLLYTNVTSDILEFIRHKS